VKRDWVELRFFVGLALIAFVVGEVGGISTCPTAGLFGVPCPSCGLTRATVALLTGRWREALGFHPLVVVVLPALTIAALGPIVRTHPNAPAWLRSPRMTWLAGASAVLVGLAAVVIWIARFFGALGGPVAVYPWFR
jgi:hypothetical protein